MQRTEKQDIYTRITNQIVSHLEKDVRPWVRPWNAEYAAGRITRHSGTTESRTAESTFSLCGQAPWRRTSRRPSG
jgi:antirestriction protein ArdC